MSEIFTKFDKALLDLRESLEVFNESADKVIRVSEDINEDLIINPILEALYNLKSVAHVEVTTWSDVNAMNREEENEVL